MDSDMDKDDLRKKVVNMFRVIAIKKYGIPSIPTVKTRQVWEKVNSAVESVIKTGAGFELIKESAQAVMSDPDHQKFFPIPLIWEGEIRRRQRLAKEQNVKVDTDMESARVDTINRAMIKTKYVEKYGVEIANKFESNWLFLKGFPDNKFMRDDFWASVNRQDAEALAIINSYEQKHQRERH